MEYLLILLIGVPLLRHWLKQRLIKRIHQKHKSHVIVYSASWCVQCHQTQVLLDEQLVIYVVIDVDDSKEAYTEFKSLGSRELPVVLINGFLIKGFQPLKVKKMTQNI